jgi:hypothetical protein
MARTLPRDRRKQTFCVRIPAGELTRMRARARKERMDLSEWMRRLLTAGLEAGK